MTGTHLPPNFDTRIGVAIKADLNHEYYRLMEAWRRSEGGDARWNPLNSSLELAGWTLKPDYNTIGVRNYAYEFAGIAATILTFASREPDGSMRYGGIVGDIQQGVKTAEEIVASRTAEFNKWGTNVGLLAAVLAGIP